MTRIIGKQGYIEIKQDDDYTEIKVGDASDYTYVEFGREDDQTRLLSLFTDADNIQPYCYGEDDPYFMTRRDNLFMFVSCAWDDMRLVCVELSDEQISELVSTLRTVCAEQKTLERQEQEEKIKQEIKQLQERLDRLNK